MEKHMYVKNMVCDRCIMVVREKVEKLGLPYKSIQLGEIEFSETPSTNQIQELKNMLHPLGFEVLDDKKSTIVEKIKNVIIKMIHGSQDIALNRKLSVVLQEELNLDYHYLTSLFSSIEGVTIEKYVILQRIEKAKELLMYDELTLSEISYKLGYSSVQHLSQQFKKITGLTPSHFKELRENKRKSLDKL